MKKIQPEIIGECPDGRPVRDYDPSDGYGESEKSGESLRVVQRMKGISFDTALKKSAERREKIVARSGYQTFIPCVRCNGCVIIRGMENGEIKNKFYACQKMKIQVERYGTCVQASEGNGPMVMEENIRLAEAMAMKDRLVN